jgi:hypothetical protein
VRKNPWSFAIDYDKAIAEDRARLAEVERLLALGITKSPDIAPGYWETLPYRAVVDAEVAAKLGLTDEDRAVLAAYTEIEGGTPVDYDALPKGWYGLGEAIAKRLTAIWDGDLPTATELKALRTKAKTDLARHLRNKEKNA